MDASVLSPSNSLVSIYLMTMVKGVGKIYSINLNYVTTYAVAVSNGIVTAVQAWTGPESTRMLKLPDFKTIGT